jgi:hypothetical protein
MIARLVLALVVFIVVGLALTALLGPILIWLGVPVATIIGEFFVKWGWVLGVLAGLWYFFAGGGLAWPPTWRR